MEKSKLNLIIEESTRWNEFRKSPIVKTPSLCKYFSNIHKIISRKDSQDYDVITSKNRVSEIDCNYGNITRNYENIF